jgi:hypothetical protein
VCVCVCVYIFVCVCIYIYISEARVGDHVTYHLCLSHFNNRKIESADKFKWYLLVPSFVKICSPVLELRMGGWTW